MHVETFEVQEVATCEGEELETVREMVKTLGLEGQERFFAEEKGACPYRKITAQEKLVYQTLCEKETEMSKYADGPIPLRIMQIGAHAQSVIEFGTLVVWHPVNGDVKDPVLLSKVKKGSWEYEYFLLARWGEVLEEFAVLQAQAAKIIAARLREALAKAKQEIELGLCTVDEAAELAVRSGVSKSVSFYFH